jgi:hypothetical protein
MQRLPLDISIAHRHWSPWETRNQRTVTLPNQPENATGMNHRNKACPFDTSPPARTSSPGTPSLYTTVNATTRTKDARPGSVILDHKAEYEARQTAQFSWSEEVFQSSGKRHELPDPAYSWARSTQSSANFHADNNTYLSYEAYRQHTSTSNRPEAIETSESPSHDFIKLETSNHGIYRCYQHGCSGRRFSSSENYRRHIRERSKSDATKCPFCGAVFTRRSNQDFHVRKGRCKGLDELLSEESNMWPSEEIVHGEPDDATCVE